MAGGSNNFLDSLTDEFVKKTTISVPGGSGVFQVVPFRNNIYIGTHNWFGSPLDSGGVWKIEISDRGLIDGGQVLNMPSGHPWGMAVFNGKLYVGEGEFDTGTPGIETTGRLFVSEDGDSFTDLGRPSGDAEFNMNGKGPITGLCVYDNELIITFADHYISSIKPLGVAPVLAYDGTTPIENGVRLLTDIQTFNPSWGWVFHPKSIDSELYVHGWKEPIVNIFDGQTLDWKAHPNSEIPKNVDIFDGHIIAWGDEIYEYGRDGIKQVLWPSGHLDRLSRADIYNGRFYIGDTNGDIYNFDGTHWRLFQHVDLATETTTQQGGFAGFVATSGAMIAVGTNGIVYAMAQYANETMSSHRTGRAADTRESRYSGKILQYVGMDKPQASYPGATWESAPPINPKPNYGSTSIIEQESSITDAVSDLDKQIGVPIFPRTSGLPDPGDYAFGMSAYVEGSGFFRRGEGKWERETIV